MFLPTRRSASSAREQAEAVELGPLPAFPRETGNADQDGRVGHGGGRPEKQRQILGRQIGKNAERTQFAFGRLDPGLLEQLAQRRGGEGFARLGDPLRDVPARRPRRMPEQQSLAIGDEDATAVNSRSRLLNSQPRRE